MSILFYSYSDHKVILFLTVTYQMQLVKLKGQTKKHSLVVIEIHPRHTKTHSPTEAGVGNYVARRATAILDIDQ